MMMMKIVINKSNYIKHSLLNWEFYIYDLDSSSNIIAA